MTMPNSTVSYQESRLQASDGLMLHMHTWRPADTHAPLRAVVAIVHGMGEHGARYASLAEHFASLGIATVAYDLRGHGRSGGSRLFVKQFDEYLDDTEIFLTQVRTTFGPTPLFLLGHSMGGAIAARFVAGALEQASWSRPVDGLVLSSPALDAGLSAFQRGLLGATLPLVPHLAVGNGLNPSWVSRSPEVVQAYKDDPLVHNRITPTLAKMIASFGPETLPFVGRWATPTLLMWAEADRCVNPAGSAAFARRAAGNGAVQAVGFPGLFHEILNEPEREQVFARLRPWLGARS